MFLSGDEALVARPLRVVKVAAALAVGLDLVDHGNEGLNLKLDQRVPRGIEGGLVDHVQGPHALSRILVIKFISHYIWVAEYDGSVVYTSE